MKKFFCLVLALLSLSFAVSCGSDSEYFEDYSVSSKGVFTWNEVAGAKYYYVTIGGGNTGRETENQWIKKNKINLSSKISEESGDVYLTIYAYRSKSTAGNLNIKELRVTIVKQAGKFCLDRDASKYTVSFDTNGFEEIPDAINDYWVTLPILLSKSKLVTGWYFDKECTQIVPGTEKYPTSPHAIFYPTRDTILYWKYETITHDVTIYADIDKTNIVREFNLENGSYINEEDMPDYIPVEGYTFIHWSSERIYSGGYKDEFSYKLEFPYPVYNDIKIYPTFEKN